MLTYAFDSKSGKPTGEFVYAQIGQFFPQRQLWRIVVKYDDYAQEEICHRMYQPSSQRQGEIRAHKHWSVSNFIMNLIAELGVYCFYDNKHET